MTPTDDAFWTALVARLTELRWGGAPGLAAGLLPRPQTSGSPGNLSGFWSGDDGRRLARTTRTGLPRRMRT